MRVFVKIALLCFILSIGFEVEAEVETEVEVEVEVEAEVEVESEVEREIISIVDLAKIMASSSNEIIISDYEITSTANDIDYLVNKVFFSLYQIPAKNASAKKIYFYNCKFNLSNSAPLVFANWNITRLNIIGSEIVSPVAFENIKHTSKKPFIIENCTFNEELKFANKKSKINGINFISNEFNSNLILDVNLGNLIINNCKFIAKKTNNNFTDNEKTYYQLSISERNIDEIKIEESTFNNSNISNIFSVDFSSASIDQLYIINTKLQTINLSDAGVNKSFLVDLLTVDNYIGILNFDFPEKNTNASWHNFAGEKLAIFSVSKSGLVVPYQAKTTNELANNVMYNDLISAYSKFNAVYHSRGDITSANQSYVEIKDIETRKQAYIQQVNPSLNNLINYKLNEFLRFFSDYATNPGKSLIQSLWVILFFTVLFMVSFSGWDGMNYKYYFSQFDRFSDYIRLRSSISDIYATNESESHKEINVLLANHAKKCDSIPRILRLFGGTLSFIGKFRYKILPDLIKFFNFQPKAWSDFTTYREKIWAGFLIVLISITFIFYVLIVKFINSFILSLNNFVVIGFGSLPENDNVFAMYFSIIEGIIGWFLLTIFTITLLSQVLQSA